MVYRHIEPFSKQLTIVVGLTVVGCMTFGLALSFYRNAMFEQTLGNIDKKNDELRSQIQLGYRQLEYYRSSQYKDKYAKENLGKVSPGENVLIITQSHSDVPPITLDERASYAAQQEAAYLEHLRATPILEHWKYYLFERDRVEALKREFQQ